MTIIKEGNASKSRYPKKFVCQVCGCEFEADTTEYSMEYKNGFTSYLHNCPTCGTECRVGRQGD